ncbi:MAG: thiamine biosynthesis protein ApbE [Deltaproteobacteria bacterium]|nr:MAG: thiamine biosynthesis protein ApbE [Deltaproteobacteria bacterium]
MKKQIPGIDVHRRTFLKLSGLLGIGVMSAGLTAVPTTADGFLFSKKDHLVTATRTAMGTFVAITILHPSKDQAQQAIHLAFDEITQLENILTHHKANAPLGIFNKTGVLEHAPLEIQGLVARAAYYNQISGGAFDITIKPVIDLYREKYNKNETPSRGDIEKALAAVGTEHILVHDRTLRAKRDGVAITLDGIGKGYIIDRAAAVLKRNGIDNFLINGGGDIRCSGHAAKNKPWTIAVQDPNKEKHYPEIISLYDGAVATSGGYEVYYDQEKIFHHIIDSRTGCSPRHARSVTVTAATVMDADALSTTVFVMGARKGQQILAAHPGAQFLLVDEADRLHRSSGWQA